jgi:Domain of unknown function (DUF4331)
MSNHFSAANLRFPGDDTRLELTDVYAFTSADGPSKTVLIMDVNPTVRPPVELPPTVITRREFHPDAVYRINIDNDGDAQADVALTFTFSELEGGAQTGTVYLATGAQAREPGAVGQVLTSSIPVSFDAMVRPVEADGIRMSAGARSEPFFADIEGAFHGFKWTGHDDFAGNDVLSIALEVPYDMLSADPMIGVWASTSLRKDGVLTQMDRGGNPTINPFVNPDSEKDLYNSRQPADDVANYLEPWSALLVKGGYPPAEARRAALMMLPDLLRYDRAKPAEYTNGRTPVDDVYSYRFAWLSNGKIPPTGLRPHDDLLNEFPYLGLPHV